MSLHIECDKCNEPLEQQGALVFAPPHRTISGQSNTEKLHLCIACYSLLEEWMYTTPLEED